MPDSCPPETTLHQQNGAWAFWLALLAILTLFVAWQWPAAQDTEWRYDEGLNVIKATLVNDGYALYADIWADQPPLLTMSLAAVFRLFGESLFAGRALVIALSTLGLIGVALLARQLGGTSAAIAAAALLATLPAYQELGRAILVGGPAVYVAALSLAAATCYSRTGSTWMLVFSGLALGVSILIKPLTAPYYLALVAAVFTKPDQTRRRILLELALLHATLVVTLVTGVLPFAPHAMARQIVGTVLRARHIPSTDTSIGAVSLVADSAAAYALPGMTALGLAGVVGLTEARRWRAMVPSLAALASSVLALVTQRPLRAHHLLLLAPPWLALAGVGMLACARAFGEMRHKDRYRTAMVRATGSALVLILAIASLIPAIRDSLATRQHAIAPRPADSWARRAPEAVMSATTADDLIFTDEPMICLIAERHTLPELSVPSSKRIETGQLTGERLIALTQQHVPQAIVASKRFWMLPNYMTWLSQHYAVYFADGPERLVLAPYAPTTPCHASTEAGMTFLGARVAYVTERGKALPMRLYWRIAGQAPNDTHAYIHLLDDSGTKWGEADLELHASLPDPTSRQSMDMAVTDCTITVSPDAPPGPKTVWVGLYRLGDGQRLALYSAKGQPIEGNQIPLSWQPVVRWEPTYAITDVATPYDTNLGNVLALQGFTLPDEPLAPGGSVELSLAWRSLAPSDANLAVFVHLVDASGQLVAQGDGPPDSGAKPTYAWIADEVVIDKRTIALPQDVSADTLSVLVGVYEPTSGARLAIMDGPFAGQDHMLLGEILLATER